MFSNHDDVFVCFEFYSIAVIDDFISMFILVKAQKGTCDKRLCILVRVDEKAI